MGKSSVFAAWERTFFTAKDAPSLNAAVRRYGFILIMLPVRHYATLTPPEANRPESWVLEAVRRRLEQFGFATRDLGLIEAMLKAGTSPSRWTSPTRPIGTLRWPPSRDSFRRSRCW